METSAWLTGRIAERTLWAEGLMTLKVDAQIQPFRPGQFLNLGLSIDGERVVRAYSLASAPGAPPEFFLTEVDGGALTPALFELPVGAPLHVQGKPEGFFTLDYVPPARHLWCVATGTGLGPFLSMLRSAEAWQRFERLIVVHGVRKQAHLGYRDEIARHSSEHEERLTYVPVVSRDPGGKGLLEGRITDALASGALEAAAGVSLDPDTSHLMLCGNPAMIAEVTELSKARGLRRHRVRNPGHITTEKYW